MTTLLERMKKAQQDRQKTFEKDTATFPFWKLEFGKSATLRLAPYNDPHTDGFWSERKVVPMTFVDPQDDSKLINFRAPCMEMFDRNRKCPVIQPVRDLYNEVKDLQNSGNTEQAERLKKIANKHWLSVTYYYQGFVISPGFIEENIPENPIRIFPFSKKLHKKVYDSIFVQTEEPFDSLPTGEFDLDDIRVLASSDSSDEQMAMALSKIEGYNFLLKKLAQGADQNGKPFADWTSGSQWLRASGKVSLTDEQVMAINQYGYHDMSKRLGTVPTEQQLEVLKEMVEVSIARMLGSDDGFWNPEWEEMGFKPYRGRQDGEEGDDSSGSSPAQSRARQIASKTEAPKSSGGMKASDVVSRIAAARGTKKTEPVAQAETPAEPETATEANDAPVQEKAEAPVVTNVEQPKTDMSQLSAKIAAMRARKAGQK